MILVDSTIWVDFFRKGNRTLGERLEANEVFVHPMVVGELACGWLPTREKVLGWLSDLPSPKQASHTEVMDLIEDRELMGRGIGYVDAHLLASTLLSAPARLWTLDRKLATAALELDVAWPKS